MVEASGSSDAPIPSQRPPRLRWARERRLRKRPEFKIVYEKGRKIRGRGLTLFDLCRNPSGNPTMPWRLGITLTRQVGGAVVRNRLRRVIREYFRTHQWELKDGRDLVVNATPGLAAMTSREIQDELGKILSRAALVR